MTRVPPGPSAAARRSRRSRVAEELSPHLFRPPADSYLAGGTQLSSSNTRAAPVDEMEV